MGEEAPFRRKGRVPLDSSLEFSVINGKSFPRCQAASQGLSRASEDSEARIELYAVEEVVPPAPSPRSGLRWLCLSADARIADTRGTASKRLPEGGSGQKHIRRTQGTARRLQDSKQHSKRAQKEGPATHLGRARGGLQPRSDSVPMTCWGGCMRNTEVHSYIIKKTSAVLWGRSGGGRPSTPAVRRVTHRPPNQGLPLLPSLPPSRARCQASRAGGAGARLRWAPSLSQPRAWGGPTSLGVSPRVSLFTRSPAASWGGGSWPPPPPQGPPGSRTRVWGEKEGENKSAKKQKARPAWRSVPGLRGCVTSGLGPPKAAPGLELR